MLPSDFLQERNAALLSLNRDRILSYFKKWGDPAVYNWLKNAEGIVFWGAVHKARASITSLPDEARQESLKWLNEHGFKPFTGGNSQ